MLDIESARDLARYKSWADERLLAAVKALPAGEASKERPTLFKTMLNTLNHAYVVDRIWRAHLEGRSHGVAALNSVLYPELDALCSAQREMDAWYVAFCDSASDALLREEVRFAFVDGAPGVMTRGSILLHVVNHTTYHRGWVADLFFQTAIRPPMTDYTVYERERRASQSPASDGAH